MKELGLTGLEITDETGKVRLERSAPVTSMESVYTVPAEVAPAAEKPQAEPDSGDYYVVKSDIVGVFYSAPAENAEPYVSIGDRVRKGQTLCEILAQSACVLMQDVMTDGKLPVYTGLNNVKFRSPVKPGDTVETKCRIKRAKHPFYFAEGTVSVGERLCVSAEFSFAIVGDK